MPSSPQTVPSPPAGKQAAPPGAWAVPLFALTLFLSACLLFTVQLMYAKMVLPRLGGAPSVWNTCVVFFQAALLLGYAYAHLATARLKMGLHVAVHAVLLALPLLTLPVRLRGGTGPPLDADPAPWLLALMAATVGPSFVAVSTSSSVLQSWFASTRLPGARDPYFLYAASNLGSIAGLLGYIVLIEPRLTLPVQSRWWMAGYVALLALTVICGLVALRHRAGGAQEAPGAASEEASPVTWKRRALWVLLAFVPSSLMLGVTTAITTDVASVPLLWVLPLLLYLLTFMYAFARRQPFSLSVPARVFPLTVVLVAFISFYGQYPLAVPMVLHHVAFLAAALVCHMRLAADRPNTRHLTEFYLLISVGGVLGGAFNTLLAPVVFNSVAEYPIVLVLACALLPAFTPRRLFWRKRTSAAAPEAAPARTGWQKPDLWDIGLPALLCVLMVLAPGKLNHLPKTWVDPASVVFLEAICLVCLLFIARPLRFALCIAALFMGTALRQAARTDTLYRDRSFYGVLRVRLDTASKHIELMHGTTLHGAQRSDVEGVRMPLTYYHPTGPIGRVFKSQAGKPVFNNVAVVGMGTGTVAAYAEKGQRFTFYEIDPHVVDVVIQRNAFTFIQDARKRGAKVNIVLGDARRSLEGAPNGGYDLMILDAFSSDAIPNHLMTREALALYQSKMKPHGLIAYHISNRNLDLTPIVAALAHDRKLHARVMIDRLDKSAGKKWDKTTSHWTVLARREEDMGDIRFDPGWQVLVPPPGARPWTDDYSNILEALIAPR